MTFTGTLAAVNAAMNGMSFLGTANYNEGHAFDSNLSIVTSDEGQTGTGGTLTDTDAATINLAAVNDAPVAVAKNVTVQANMGLNDVPDMLVGVTDPDSGDPGYVAGHTLTAVTASSCAGCTITDIQAAAGTFDLNAGPGLTGAHTLTVHGHRQRQPGRSSRHLGPGHHQPHHQRPGDLVRQRQRRRRRQRPDVEPVPDLRPGRTPSTPTGHRIFLFEGNYADGITLNADEQLIGQGFTGAHASTPPSASHPPANTPARPALALTRPTIYNLVTLGGNNDVVRGLNLTAGLRHPGHRRRRPHRHRREPGQHHRRQRPGGQLHQLAPARQLHRGRRHRRHQRHHLDQQLGPRRPPHRHRAPAPPTARPPANCTGGAIQNTTGPGVSVSNLNSTAALCSTLTNVLVQNGGDDGIAATTVMGVVLTNLFVNNNGDAADEDSVDLVNMTGPAGCRRASSTRVATTTSTSSRAPGR